MMVGDRLKKNRKVSLNNYGVSYFVTLINVTTTLKFELNVELIGSKIKCPNIQSVMN